ncbi:hypothetical protein NSQ51_13720 [Geobacillus sp. FSL K6-0789]|uniref:Uncharacterized protein n=2 Tax=Geobacillus TaxID=129337 RepID=A0A150MXE4_GEOSE|nr:MULTISPECIES: hypothetical protein [Geobacillus]ASS98416.1 hypothetical protein GT3921_04735 [Geobacillus thermocatenulatus]KYD29131.1 hypothetical protein B4109_2462 [Geobacillus stearothermophilus]MED3732082.1 hypothetical protein [Geobacillus stearothermophilus]MED3733446.1 hypothetical protein [Geobacillus stearothermophilus]MED3741676.1 hypothetical protein [Geobacillus stearothermophilus]
MSTLEAVVIDGQKYLPIIENDEVIGVKRFNEKHGMWVVVKFMESNVNAERELLEMLTQEYIRQKTESNN